MTCGGHRRALYTPRRRSSTAPSGPNPSPRWFGFHEVFHALTIVAFIAHYVAVSLALTGPAIV